MSQSPWSCEQVFERLSDFIDGDVTADERAAILKHLEGCTACAQYGHSFGELVQLLRAHFRDTPAEEPPASLHARILAELGLQNVR
ncbi:MAG: zf-HC2 domain-containing protein [Myxococcaceae bacterium]